MSADGTSIFCRSTFATPESLAGVGGTADDNELVGALLFDETLGAVTEDASTTASGSPASQVDTITLSGTYEVGDSVTATVNGVDVAYTVLTADVTAGNATATRTAVAAKLAAAINSNTNLTDFITASTSGSVLTITSDTAGLPFSLAAAATLAGVTLQEIPVRPAEAAVTRGHNDDVVRLDVVEDERWTPRAMIIIVTTMHRRRLCRCSTTTLIIVSILFEHSAAQTAGIGSAESDSIDDLEFK